MGKQDQLTQWRERLERFESSGFSIRDYCRRNNLKIHQLVYWRDRIKKLGQTQGRFVEISGGKKSVEVQIGDRGRIVVGSNYDPIVVKSLVELLSDAKS